MNGEPKPVYLLAGSPGARKRSGALLQRILDVEEGLRGLKEQRMVHFLRRIHARGVPFVGVSAGSIMLARAWVRWSDPGDNASARRFECLGIAPVHCDTHAEEEGWEELQALLRLSDDGSVGYGIPSGGALGVFPDGSVAALGLPVRRFMRCLGRVRPLSSLKAKAQ